LFVPALATYYPTSKFYQYTAKCQTNEHSPIFNSESLCFLNNVFIDYGGNAINVYEFNEHIFHTKTVGYKFS
jgi:hypothetical protein